MVSWLNMLKEMLLGSPLDRELPEDAGARGSDAWAGVCLRKCLTGRSRPEHEGTVLGILAGATGQAWELEGRRIVYRPEALSARGYDSRSNTPTRLSVYITSSEEGGGFKVALEAEASCEIPHCAYRTGGDEHVRVITTTRAVLHREYPRGETRLVWDRARFLAKEANTIQHNLRVAAFCGTRALVPQNQYAEKGGLPFVAEKGWAHLG